MERRPGFGTRDTVPLPPHLQVIGDDVTQEQAFAHVNDVLKNAVGGISDIIHIPGLVNVDFEAVKTVMSEPGKAMMGTATAGGPDRANKAADNTPSVWRSARSQAAAKVDALASNGMDEIEIPAFVRKEAD